MRNNDGNTTKQSNSWLGLCDCCGKKAQSRYSCTGLIEFWLCWTCYLKAKEKIGIIENRFEILDL